MRVAITTLGCKVNQYDSAVIERMFGAESWQQVDFSDRADAYVVNTCTVTDRADRDARRIARRARRANPAARVILTGCYAQTNPGEIAELDYVDYIIGIGRLPDLLAAVSGELTQRVAVSDLRHAKQVATVGIESFSGRTRAFVKVQEGCNLFCTFCIVPLARGASRSVSPRAVIDEIVRLEARGFREVVITGVHLGGYGRDLQPASNLAWLLEAIAERAPRLRIRISSIDPPEITQRLVDVVADNPIFCPHFHVPLQSASDAVLSRMGRKYTLDEAAAALQLIASRLPDACIGTDLITGFPAESDEEFGAGMQRIEELELSYLHVFPYSKRRSTAAAKRWPELPDHVVHERARMMRSLDRRLRRRFRHRFLGRRSSVLFENARDRDSGLLKGYSDNYLPVLCAAGDDWMNRITNVEIIGQRSKHLEARLLTAGTRGAGQPGTPR